MRIFILISIFVLLITFYIYFFYKTYQKRKENQILKQKNQKLKEEWQKINAGFLKIGTSMEEKTRQIQQDEDKIQDLRNQIQQENQKLTQAILNTKTSFASYVETLEDNYKQSEKEYQQYKEKLSQSYEQQQEQILNELLAKQKELQQIKDTKNALIQANLKEKEIEENIHFYCINLQSNEKHDIKVLEEVKYQLSTPRILSMLIWQTYFRDKANELCNNIVGIKSKCGIYKITNQITKECYIGQSVDIAKRFKDHMKCGLDIDRPQGNKLYQAMLKDGLWNFSFEILEECSKENLNIKEKTYIDIYQSQSFGYNSTIGNNK